MACRQTVLAPATRLEYYRQRAAKVKSEAFGDEAEACKEALEMFEELGPARELANGLAEPDEE